MEVWWEKHTLPILRHILTDKMGVPEDSDRLKLLREDYMVEGIHLDTCDEIGVKKTATFDAKFNTEYEARDFADWVTFRDGIHVTEPLMEEDHQYCGTKVREDAQVTNFGPACSGGSELSDSTGYYESSSSKSPHENDGGGSPHESDGGGSPHEDYSYRAATRSAAGLVSDSAAAHERASGAFPGSETPQRPAQRSGRCSTQYQVEWTARIQPGTQTQQTPGNFVRWPHDADVHFYLETNLLIRKAAARRMGDGVSPESDDILLASVSHVNGQKVGSACERRVQKLVTYRFVLDQRQDAIRFRDDLAADASEALFEEVSRQDPEGVCKGSGQVGEVKPVLSCRDGAGDSDTSKTKFSFDSQLAN